jgi:hypothetical protein
VHLSLLLEGRPVSPLNTTTTQPCSLPSCWRLLSRAWTHEPKKNDVVFSLVGTLRDSKFETFVGGVRRHGNVIRWMKIIRKEIRPGRICFASPTPVPVPNTVQVQPVRWVNLAVKSCYREAGIACNRSELRSIRHCRSDNTDRRIKGRKKRLSDVSFFPTLSVF